MKKDKLFLIEGEFEHIKSIADKDTASQEDIKKSVSEIGLCINNINSIIELPIKTTQIKDFFTSRPSLSKRGFVERQE